MKHFILLTLALFLTIGCTDTNTVPTETISFSLVKYTPSTILPQTATYTLNQIIWSFDFENQTITIETEEGVESPVLQKGTYTYTLVANSCNYGNNKTLVVNGQQYGVLILDELKSGKIQISSECLDGHKLVFQKSTK